MDTKEKLTGDATKTVYTASQNDQVVIEFQDSLKNDLKLEGIAELNNSFSAFIFDYLESYNVPTHFAKSLNPKSFLAKRLQMIPISISVYNIAAKDLVERFGIAEGKTLEYPIVELHFKDDRDQRPMINEYHAYALGLCDRKEMTSIIRIATKVNAVLKSFFDRRKLKLVHFQLEFGRNNGQILLGEGFTMDSMALWSVNNEGELEKIVDEKKQNIQTYQDLLSRILGKDA